MGVLQRFETRLEGLVEGAFAKVFKGVVHPVEIASAMQREADAHRSILAGGRTLVPNRYVVDLSPNDHDRLEEYAAALAQELAQTQAEYIGEQGWTVYGDVIVEIERGDGLDTGMFRVVSEVFTGSPDDSGPIPAAEPTYGPSDDDRSNAGYGPAAGASGGQGGYAPPGTGPYPPGPAQPHRTPRLVAGDGRTYSISVGSTVLGRGESCQIRVADVGVSRQHARVDFDGNRVMVTDLGSTNGTIVNGSRIQATALGPGDVVQVGTTSLTLRLDG